MKTIWKYDIKPASKQEIAMPEGAVILTVQTQRGSPCLWVEVETTKQLEGRVFEIFGTGHPMSTDIGVERKYIGTYQIDEGAIFVFHVYERMN